MNNESQPNNIDNVTELYERALFERRKYYYLDEIAEMGEDNPYEVAIELMEKHEILVFDENYEAEELLELITPFRSEDIIPDMESLPTLWKVGKNALNRYAPVSAEEESRLIELTYNARQISSELEKEDKLTTEERYTLELTKLVGSFAREKLILHNGRLVYSTVEKLINTDPKITALIDSYPDLRFEMYNEAVLLLARTIDITYPSDARLSTRVVPRINSDVLKFFNKKLVASQELIQSRYGKQTDYDEESEEDDDRWIDDFAQFQFDKAETDLEKLYNRCLDALDGYPSQIESFRAMHPLIDVGGIAPEVVINTPKQASKISPLSIKQINGNLWHVRKKLRDELAEYEV